MPGGASEAVESLGDVIAALKMQLTQAGQMIQTLSKDNETLKQQVEILSAKLGAERGGEPGQPVEIPIPEAPKARSKKPRKQDSPTPIEEGKVEPLALVQPEG